MKNFTPALVWNIAALFLLAVRASSCGQYGLSTVAPNSTTSLPSPTPPPNIIPPVSCNLGINNSPAVTRIYPTSCLNDPTGYLASPNWSTPIGFEMNNLQNDNITLNSDDPSGTQTAVNLYIEIATYVQPDTITINATSAADPTQVTQLLYICNYSTDTVADPTKPAGKVRPYSDTIVQFIVPLPVGTGSLSVSVDDNTPYNSGSPTYVGIWNLNEFHNAIQGIPTSGLGTGTSYNFRPQSGLLTEFNDTLDPNNNANPYCTAAPW